MPKVVLVMFDLVLICFVMFYKLIYDNLLQFIAVIYDFHTFSAPFR